MYQLNLKSFNAHSTKREEVYSQERISRGIFIHQTKHVENILKKFKILGFRFAYTPLLEGLVLVNNTKSTLCNVTFFCKLVEKLIFLIITRLDIAYALNS
uniref:Reverse transcriptase Ty1/copia-type domain-containing protein n=1 Tax=Physcomitrium patens TaxID=3218 RepID=A0A2K1IJX8_PHYPA|nr:hypothetical protein PHYPA_028276 [Physcomitrium patens]